MRKDKDILSQEGQGLQHTSGMDYCDTTLKGKFLVSMPTLLDDRFHKSVIYLCRNDASGSMGIVINRDYGRITFGELLGQIDPKENKSDAENFEEGIGAIHPWQTENSPSQPETPLEEKFVEGEYIRVHYGGPVEVVRGFVLHTNDFQSPDSEDVGNQLILTSTIDILKAIATGEGPSKSLFALGYAGWGPGQLEDEIKANGWLVVDGKSELVFQTDIKTRWDAALAILGVNPVMLSNFAGNA